MIEGKPRGKLVKCNHEEYANRLSMKQDEFVRAVIASSSVIEGIEKMNRLRHPDWLKT